MTSNGKQLTVSREMLTAVARDRWNLSAVFAFVLFCYITNHLVTGPLGNSEFCFPRTSMSLQFVLFLIKLRWPKKNNFYDCLCFRDTRSVVISVKGKFI